MSGVRTWSLFYSDRGGLNSVLVIQGSYFLKKKRKKKSFQKTKQKKPTQRHTHTYTRHLYPFSQNQSQTGFRIRRAWDHVVDVRPWGSESTLWRHLMVFQDADSCKQQALPNSGNSGGQLGGRTFLDIHTHTKQKNTFKKSTKKKNPSWQHCQEKH